MPLLKKFKDHISRSWEDEPEQPHPQLKILPPIMWELISYLIIGGLLYSIVNYFLLG